MKKIAILCNSTAWGGLEINAAKLALTLKKKYPCTLLIPSGSPVENYARQNNIDHRSWSGDFKYYDPRLLFFIKELIKEKSFDILFSSTTKDIYSIVFQKLFFKIKTVHVQQMQFGIN
jgi:hypothetical protein